MIGGAAGASSSSQESSQKLGDLALSRRTLCAQAVVNNFGKIDRECALLRRVDTRRLAHRARNVNEAPAVAAQQMMMVIVVLDFVERRAPIGRHAPQNTHVGQRVERIVNGLLRDLAQFAADLRNDGLGVHVFTLGNHGQNG